VSVGAEVTSGDRLFQRRLAFQPPETHDRRQWKAIMYVWSLAARMTTTGDGGRLESATCWMWSERCGGARPCRHRWTSMHGQREIDAFRRPQPVKVSKHLVTCSYWEDRCIS